VPDCGGVFRVYEIKKIAKKKNTPRIESFRHREAWPRAHFLIFGMIWREKVMVIPKSCIIFVDNKETE
jgi:hypothetical protein